MTIPIINRVIHRVLPYKRGKTEVILKITRSFVNILRNILFCVKIKKNRMTGD